MHMRRARRQRGQHAGIAAGGEQAGVVADGAAVGQVRDMLRGIERGDAGAQPQLDVLVRIEAGGVHAELAVLSGVGQHGLGQRRALVWRVLFAACHDDAAAAAKAAQRRGGHGPGLAGADDQDGRVLCHDRLPYSSTHTRLSSILTG
ncbi:hypothetical protein D3C81_1134260 [compost metagenome]